MIADYGNYRIYRIHDIDFKKTPSTQVKFRDGMDTLLNYYKKGYNIVIKDKSQPLLIYEQRQKNCHGEPEINYLYLIPELCKFAGLLDYQINDIKFKQNLAKITKLEPATRMGRINEYAKKIQNSLCQKQSSISLSQPLSVEGYNIDKLQIDVNS